MCCCRLCLRSRHSRVASSRARPPASPPHLHHLGRDPRSAQLRLCCLPPRARLLRRARVSAVQCGDGARRAEQLLRAGHQPEQGLLKRHHRACAAAGGRRGGEGVELPCHRGEQAACGVHLLLHLLLQRQLLRPAGAAFAVTAAVVVIRPTAACAAAAAAAAAPPALQPPPPAVGDAGGKPLPRLRHAQLHRAAAVVAARCLQYLLVPAAGHAQHDCGEPRLLVLVMRAHHLRRGGGVKERRRMQRCWPHACLPIEKPQRAVPTNGKLKQKRLQVGCRCMRPPLKVHTARRQPRQASPPAGPMPPTHLFQAFRALHSGAFWRVLHLQAGGVVGLWAAAQGGHSPAACHAGISPARPSSRAGSQGVGVGGAVHMRQQHVYARTASQRAVLRCAMLRCIPPLRGTTAHAAQRRPRPGGACRSRGSASRRRSTRPAGAAAPALQPAPALLPPPAPRARLQGPQMKGHNVLSRRSSSPVQATGRECPPLAATPICMLARAQPPTHLPPSWPAGRAAACAAPAAPSAARRPPRRSTARAWCRRRRRPLAGGPPSAAGRGTVRYICAPEKCMVRTSIRCPATSARVLQRSSSATQRHAATGSAGQPAAALQHPTTTHLAFAPPHRRRQQVERVPSLDDRQAGLLRRVRRQHSACVAVGPRRHAQRRRARCGLQHLEG